MTGYKKCNNNVLLKMAQLDEAANRYCNGCYTVPPETGAPLYRVKQLCEYALAKGKDTSELTEEELALFLIPEEKK